MLRHLRGKPINPRKPELGVTELRADEIEFPALNDVGLNVIAYLFTARLSSISRHDADVFARLGPLLVPIPAPWWLSRGVKKQIKSDHFSGHHAQGLRDRANGKVDRVQSDLVCEVCLTAELHKLIGREIAEGVVLALECNQALRKPVVEQVLIEVIVGVLQLGIRIRCGIQAVLLWNR